MKNRLACLSASLIAAASSPATPIAVYDFTAGATTSSDTETLTVAGAMLSGSGVTPAFTSDRVEIGGDDTPYNYPPTPNPSSLDDAMAPAIATDSYLSFIVTIGSDVEVDLTSIDFDYSSINGFDFGFGVFTDITGFTVGSELAGVFGNEASNPSLSGPIDLSGIPSLQNLTDTSVEFRFYFMDRSGVGTRIHVFDSVSLEAAVAALSASPTITDFSYDPTDGSAEVSIAGAANTNYKLVEADDLDFSNPDQDPVDLTGAAVTVGTLDGNEVTTDGSGHATVQFTLGTAKDATFLRAETAP